MIKVKGRKVIFTGKHAALWAAASKELGLSPQELLTGCLWEYIMQLAREGAFKGGKNR